MNNLSAMLSTLGVDQETMHHRHPPQTRLLFFLISISMASDWLLLLSTSTWMKWMHAPPSIDRRYWNAVGCWSSRSQASIVELVHIYIQRWCVYQTMFLGRIQRIASVGNMKYRRYTHSCTCTGALMIILVHQWRQIISVWLQSTPNATSKSLTRS